MVDVENLAELYWEKLSSTTNPGPVLARFMGELLGRTIDKSHVIMMNKFIKTYDRFLVFLSILDLADVRDLGENLYPLLSSICKRRFEKKHSSSVVVQYDRLNREVTRLEKLREKMQNSKKKLKIPSSDDLDKDS